MSKSKLIFFMDERNEIKKRWKISENEEIQKKPEILKIGTNFGMTSWYQHDIVLNPGVATLIT